MATEGSPFLGTLVPIAADGTVKLPMDKLDTAGIEAGTQIEIFADSEAMYLRTTTQRCGMCNKNAKTQPFLNLKLCDSCIDRLMAQAREQAAKEQAAKEAAEAAAKAKAEAEAKAAEEQAIKDATNQAMLDAAEKEAALNGE